MKKFALAGLTFLAPVLVLAQSTNQTVDSAQALSKFVIDFINNIGVPLVFALSFIFFIVGIFMYFIAGGADEAKRTKGKELMIYGIIGFFVMISVWGLVRILTGTIRLDNATPTQNNGLPRAENTRAN